MGVKVGCAAAHPPSTGAQKGKNAFPRPINSHYVSYEGGAKAPKVKTAVKVLGGGAGEGLYYVIKPLGSFYLMMMKRLLCYGKRIGGGEKWLKT